MAVGLIGPALGSPGLLFRRGLPLRGEHVEHPVGHQEAAHHVHRSQEHGHEPEHPGDRGVGRPQDEHRAHQDNPMDRVGPAHEGRVEDDRNLRDHLVADEDGEHEYGQVVQQGVDHGALPAGAAAWAPRRSAVGACTTLPSCVTQVSRTMSSSKFKRRAPSFTSRRKNEVMFREYIWLAWTGSVEASRTGPWIVTPSTTTSAPGLVSSQFPPMSAARSTITDPGFIRRTSSAVISLGAVSPGTRAVVMITSAWGMRARRRSCAFT